MPTAVGVGGERDALQPGTETRKAQGWQGVGFSVTE